MVLNKDMVVGKTLEQVLQEYGDDYANLACVYHLDGTRDWAGGVVVDCQKSMAKLLRRNPAYRTAVVCDYNEHLGDDVFRVRKEVALV